MGYYSSAVSTPSNLIHELRRNQFDYIILDTELVSYDKESISLIVESFNNGDALPKIILIRDDTTDSATLEEVLALTDAILEKPFRGEELEQVLQN